METKKGPVKKFRAGAVSATVWNNPGKEFDGKEAGTYNTVSLERSYKDKDGAWKTTSSLRLNDLPKVAVVVNKAYEFLVLNKESTEEGEAA
ncbi:MAG: hypothetical protein AABX98_03780 [Nanoarchaeota archaeon]